MTKVEQLIEVLKGLLSTEAPGRKLASVEELQDSIPGGAGIGTVIRAVQQAQAMGLPIVAVRGQDGGYFHGPYENRVAPVTDGDGVDLTALLAHAHEIRRAVDDLIVRLETAAA
jgi:predicted DNA-binding transcriptional regulator YafY